MAKCDECTSSVDCEDCASGYLWDGSKCDLDCPEGKYKGATECLDCPKGCAVCTSKYHCSSCKTDYNLYAGSCREDCPTGTFSKDQVCYHCVVPC